MEKCDQRRVCFERPVRDDKGREGLESSVAQLDVRGREPLPTKVPKCLQHRVGQHIAVGVKRDESVDDRSRMYMLLLNQLAEKQQRLVRSIARRAEVQNAAVEESLLEYPAEYLAVLNTVAFRERAANDDNRAAARLRWCPRVARAIGQESHWFMRTFIRTMNAGVVAPSKNRVGLCPANVLLLSHAESLDMR